MLAGIDMGYMINHAMFQRNGRVGYVLKPLALRSPDKTELARRTEHALVVTVGTLSSLMFSVYSCWRCLDHLSAAVAPCQG